MSECRKPTPDFSTHTVHYRVKVALNPRKNSNDIFKIVKSYKIISRGCISITSTFHPNNKTTIKTPEQSRTIFPAGGVYTPFPKHLNIHSILGWNFIKNIIRISA